MRFSILSVRPLSPVNALQAQYHQHESKRSPKIPPASGATAAAASASAKDNLQRRQISRVWSCIFQCLMRDPHVAVADTARAVVGFMLSRAATPRHASSMRRSASLPQALSTVALPAATAQSQEGAQQGSAVPSSLDELQLGGRVPVAPATRAPNAPRRSASIALGKEHSSARPGLFQQLAAGRSDARAEGKANRMKEGSPPPRADPSREGPEVDNRADDPAWKVPPSSIYQSSCRYFQQHLMKEVKEDDDDAMDQQWRNRRNLELVRETEKLWGESNPDTPNPFEGVAAEHKKRSGETRRNVAAPIPAKPPASPPRSPTRTRAASPAPGELSFVQRLFFGINGFGSHSRGVSQLSFHPFEDLLAGASTCSHVCLWDTRSDRGSAQQHKINSFRNRNPAGTRITGLSWANDLAVSRLITASDDGAVRVWRDPHVQGGASLATAWVAAPGMIRGENRPGLIMSWQQARGRVVTAGNSTTVRLWDAACERLVTEVSVHSNREFVSHICSDESGRTLFVGMVDGTVHRIDTRSRHSRKTALYKHRGRVVSVCIQRTENHRVISGSVAGDVHVFDARVATDSKLIPSVSTHRFKSLHALVAHDYAPVIAVGSHDQFVKIFDTAGGEIKNIRYHEVSVFSSNLI